MDRKLQEADKSAEDDEDWMERAEAALKSVYGYEFQGDSLFIARANVLDAFLENFEARFCRVCDRDLLLKEANVVSWNFWQMDGRTQSPPVRGRTRSVNDLFNDNPPCRIRFWDQSRSTPFSNIRLEERRGMKRFYAVIGNPPYQSAEKESGANFHASIYPQFMEQAYQVADKVELITPARFLSGAGRVDRKWSQKILKDPHFSVLYREQDSKKVFPNIDLKGGVCISLWDRKQVHDLQKSLTQFPELNSIEKKVSAFPTQSLMDFVRPDYHYSEKMGEEIPWAFPYISSSGQERRITTNSFKTQREKLNGTIFFDPKPEDKGEWVQILGLDDKNKRTYKYVKRDYIRDADQGDLAKWKVFVPKSNGSGAIGEILSTPLIGQPLIGQPLIGHTRTFLSIGSFDTEAEAEACLKYIKSKFARAMLGILKVTQDNPKDTWKYVPWQDFSPSSDIDWAQSIPDIDRQLYQKYGLNEEEIAFIESNVKEMK
ncbi:MAG: Eco57I restriction-modification methylase domain-containing protein [Aeriscardovia sp.]|nr:Eco57I restriction-modification methylase domain-containing protein [Aeriscardovia sp.]